MATPPEAGAATPAEAAPRAASDAAELARAVGTSMFAADHATRVFMQMELLGCEPGHARMRMTVRELHLNGHQICPGQEQTLQGRHGIYDMRVENQRGEVVAMFRGKSAQIAGTVVPDTPGS